MKELTAAEVRAIRQGLGVTAEWLANHLDVQTRTVQRWESGDNDVKPSAAEAILSLEAEATEQVAAHVEAFTTAGGPAPKALTIKDASQSADRPSGWHRMIAFRVRQELPDLRIIDPASAAASSDDIDAADIGESPDAMHLGKIHYQVVLCGKVGTYVARIEPEHFGYRDAAPGGHFDLTVLPHIIAAAKSYFGRRTLRPIWVHQSLSVYPAPAKTWDGPDDLYDWPSLPFIVETDETVTYPYVHPVLRIASLPSTLPRGSWVHDPTGEEHVPATPRARGMVNGVRWGYGGMLDITESLPPTRRKSRRFPRGLGGGQ